MTSASRSPIGPNKRVARSLDAAPLNVLQLRRQLGMSQKEFWHRLGVTQSGGSRYEKGRPIPLPVVKLCRLIYLDGKGNVARSSDDAVIQDYLARNPDLRTWLLRCAREAMWRNQK